MCACVCVCVCVYIYVYISTTKNNVLPFATTWVNPECIMPYEITQTKKDENIIGFHSHVKSNTSNTNKQNKNS